VAAQSPGEDHEGVRLMMISGSTRTGSTNTAALRTVRAIAPTDVVAVLYAGLPDLPAFSPDADDEPPPAVRHLRAELAAADAVLFCSPEYAGSLPGSLKNLLDWTVGSGELYGKPVAWLNIAAPGRGGGAQDQLRTVLSYVGAEVIEDGCLRLTVAREAVGPDSTVTDEPLRAAVAESLEVITRHVRLRMPDRSR